MVLQFSLFSLYIKISSFKIKAGWLGGKKIKMVKHLITWTFWYTKKKGAFLFELSFQSCHPPCGRSPKKSLAFLTLRLCDQVWCSAQMYEDAALSSLPFFWTKKDKPGTVYMEANVPPCILSPRRWRRSPVTCGWFRELGRHGLERNWKYSGWFRINMDPVPFPCPTTINFAIKIQALSLSAGVWGSHLRPWISVHTTGPSLFVGLLDWPETWPGATDQNLEQIWVWQWPHLGDFHDSRFNVSV